MFRLKVGLCKLLSYRCVFETLNVVSYTNGILIECLEYIM